MLACAERVAKAEDVSFLDLTEVRAARVVLDPGGAHLVPGEVLVVPSTDPGWRPLFLTAGDS